ncbi:CheB methylesterase domain-containing protein [Legionella yabuuchiae]|uniref:CheB methylesterase domain-containing protein n=1 Tax=Legionella yabuuchiae TaxID=376727 RepID=UPI001055A8A1|nr:CheB methylesterase domain-containing protein [Legionella yabuuchiae]
MKSASSKLPSRLKKLVLIGASTGGPKAVRTILQDLPNDLPAAIIVLQHMPELFIANFANRLNSVSALTVEIAKNMDRLKPGHVFIAPYGFDLILEETHVPDEPYRLILIKNTDCTTSPSVDATFKSAAALLGHHVLGVILTGMGKDGVKGCLAIKLSGGRTIAQDEATSAVFGMPKSAIHAEAIDRVLPIHKIPSAIIEEVTGAS